MATRDKAIWLARHLLGMEYSEPTSMIHPGMGHLPMKPGGWYRDGVGVAESWIGSGGFVVEVIEAMRGRLWKLTLEAWPLPKGITNVGFRHHVTGDNDGGSATTFGDAVIEAAFNVLTGDGEKS